MKDKGLWKLPNGRDRLRGKLDLVLLGGAMLSKSLIQFSVDGWSCVPSLLFTWGPTMVEKEMATHSSILGLENPMDGGAWWAILHRVAKSRHD